MASSLEYGWIVPARGPDESSLEDFLGAMVRNLCGIKHGLARPRYQQKPPRAPESHIDWCAFGILGEGAPGGAVWHENGQSRLLVDENFTALFSFYGPGARENARALRDGLWIEQNRAILRMEHNLALVRLGEITPVPELVDMRWLKRFDLSVDFVRGPELPARGQKEAEGDLDIKDLESAKPCGLCGRSR